MTERTISKSAVNLFAITLMVCALNVRPAMSETVGEADSAVPEKSESWTGAYLGLQLGYDRIQNGDFGTNLYTGVVAGYDWDVGTWVVGGSIEVDRLGFEVGGQAETYTLTRLKLRAGYDAGRTLIYGVTGAARVSDGLAQVGQGYLLGAGIEYKTSERVSISGEVATNRFDGVVATTLGFGVNYRF